MRNVKLQLPRSLTNVATWIIARNATAHGVNADSVDMGVGGGRASFGSRGTRTFSLPPTTRTAPFPAAPISGSHTLSLQVNENAHGGFTVLRHYFASGLAGAILGACLFGILFVHGLFDELNTFDDFLRLLIEGVAVMWFLVLIVRCCFNSSEAPVRSEAPQGEGDEIGIIARDLDAFENMLAAVQVAYSREDNAALSRLLTHEMMTYAQEEMDKNKNAGFLNRISGIQLLQGDVAEAWREGMTEYATVALRFQLRDVLVDRETGRTIIGDEGKPLETAEIWTFRRDVNSPWKLSAIQHVKAVAA